MSVLEKNLNDKIEKLKKEHLEAKKHAQSFTNQRLQLIEKTHDERLNSFVTSNLETPSMYNSLYSYIADTAASWISPETANVSDPEIEPLANPTPYTGSPTSETMSGYGNIVEPYPEGVEPGSTGYETGFSSEYEATCVNATTSDDLP